MAAKKSFLKEKTIRIDKIKEILPSFEPFLNKAQRYIPICEPELYGNELKYVTDCLKSNWISSLGLYVNKFEESFSSFCNADFGIACSSGTSALHLALAAAGIEKGDEVIIPTFTMIAVANTVSYAGATPVFVDAHPESWNIDPDKIEEKINDKTKAIIVVHTYGNPADMDRIIKIARKHGLFIIEDASEAHGAEYKGRKAGSMGDAACFSFYGNKIITTGEGGMLVTKNKRIAKIARILRDHGFSKRRHFWHKYLGFNYRMTNLQAAVGLAQMEQIDKLIGKRIAHAQCYNSLLGKIKSITLPPNTSAVKNVFWLYSILIGDDFKISRDKLRNKLAHQGVETRAFFIPMHLQPLYYKKYYRGKFPVAEKLCAQGICLPSSSLLKDNQIKLIASLIKRYSL